MTATRGRSPGPGGAPRSVPTARDCRKYAREFVRTDLDRDGFITAQEAKALLERSGLGNEVLLRIWDMVDVNRMNCLGFREFVAAMHLILLARAGHFPPPPPAGLPLVLVEFLRGLQASPEQLALEGSSRSASASRSRSATPQRADRPAPTRRDCRKYAREFQRMDADRDGALTADEARNVFLRSGLSNETLGQVYELVDGSHSGRLGFAEFVAAMHLISLARAGRPLPSPAAGLPSELVNFLMGLQDSPWELALEGSSRSASRARTEGQPSQPAEEGSWSGTFGATAVEPEPVPTPPFDTVPAPFDGSTPTSLDLARPLEAQPQPELDLSGAGKKREKKKKDRQHDQGVAAAAPAEFGLGNCELPASPLSAPRSSPPTRMGLPVPNLAEDGSGYGNLGNDSAHSSAYDARLREILGLEGQDNSPSASATIAESSSSTRRWFAESKEGAYDPRRTQVGDYESPVMWTVLMGAKPVPGASGGAARFRAAGAAVRPPAAAPFLRTIVPNHPRLQSGPGGNSGVVGQHIGQRFSVPPSALQTQQGSLPSSTPSAQVLYERLSALPTAYTSQVSMLA
mmetsp:Transcript_106839/g.297435  ORF Transcript_106839/g.297435 Transcript_106839/m.297435 type:complete len:573 (+) Transcript_106839:70-1788(+)|eukprot:CAMPEP_0179096606 /NCGR_PEP_ID=MMETSP0796-20121207/44421_1 /TAXON_ID=73915 /ORGANISM="Pyrodinium bahamense, Strain pbaha01" /LENGTH=572 /DNA_ID=CAMNT_0020794331 /DNA_START=1 /DNA_END=1715 /DNA_ORIENTATION=+